jgi:hypothetical protein
MSTFLSYQSGDVFDTGDGLRRLTAVADDHHDLLTSARRIRPPCRPSWSSHVDAYPVKAP